MCTFALLSFAAKELLTEKGSAGGRHPLNDITSCIAALLPAPGRHQECYLVDPLCETNLPEQNCL